MNKLMNLASALTIAAALALTTASCTNEDIQDNLAETPSLTQPQKVHITVGAGIDNNETRSAVVNENGKRVLTFTAGDKLYVYSTITEAYDEHARYYGSKIMAGFLTIIPSTISADGKSAQFTGDLTVYDGNVSYTYGQNWVVDVEGHNEQQEVFYPAEGHEEPVYDTDPDTGEPIEIGSVWVEDVAEHYEMEDVWVDEVGHYEEDPDQVYWDINYTEGTHTFSTSDPLGECVYTQASLVHNGTESAYEIDTQKYGRYPLTLASSVEDLMEQRLDVSGYYSEGSIYLSANMAILNCTISGLTAGKQYKVELWDDYDEAFDNGCCTYDGFTTANASGVATFALPTCPVDEYFKLVLIGPGEKKQVMLGRKSLDVKVYNISRAASDVPGVVMPALSRSDGLDVNELYLDNPDCYYIYGTNGTEADINMSISGNSVGYSFTLNSGGTVTLGGNGTASGIDFPYLYAYSDLTVMLATDYTIVTNEYFALRSDGNLKLGVTSGTKTLTVTVTLDGYKGLYGGENFGGSDFSALAAPGCTVTLTSEKDNGNDTYTFVYTVTKN